MVRKFNRAIAAFALPALLAGCGAVSSTETDAARGDAELIDTNTTDPAITAALSDPIMVDPTLAQQKNGNVIRPPGKPYAGPVPRIDVASGGTGGALGEQLMSTPAPVTAEGCKQCETARGAMTLGALAARQKGGKASGCAANLNYSASWAQRLPADLPLHPDARVVEAAGAPTGSCGLRVVTFWTPHPMQHMLDWYYTRATRGGYASEHQADGDDHVLGGTRTRDGASYVLFLTPRQGGGTDVDMVVTGGN